MITTATAPLNRRGNTLKKNLWKTKIEINRKENMFSFNEYIINLRLNMIKRSVSTQSITHRCSLVCVCIFSIPARQPRALDSCFEHFCSAFYVVLRCFTFMNWICTFFLSLLWYSSNFYLFVSSVAAVQKNV